MTLKSNVFVPGMLLLMAVCVSSQQLLNITKSESNSTNQTETESRGLFNTEKSSNILYKVKERDTITIRCPVELSKHASEPDNMYNDQYEQYSNYDEENSNEDEYETEDEEPVAPQAKSRKRDDSSKSESYLIVQWFKDQTRINKLNYPVRFQTEGPYLKIKNVNMNDSGKYKCKVINGFGSITATVNLNVEEFPIKEINETTTSSTSTTSTKSRQAPGSKPVFLNSKSDSGKSRSYLKLKGAQIRFKCRATGQPRPDIIWYKNGEVLSEEEYGITRSKWTLELKDLRIEDSGNYTCQVYNKFGFINSTFSLKVYEDSQIFEGLDPLNTTILSGSDAVFNCKVKSNKQPNIKWMKQISRDEYTNYVINNKKDQEQSQHKDKIEFRDDKTNKPTNNNDETLYLYKLLNPKSPLVNDDYDTADSFDTDLLLNNIKSKDKKRDSKQDSFSDDDLLSDLIGDVSTTTMMNTLLINDDDDISDSDSVHYITLSSSPLISEKITYNKENNYYVNQLVIKQADVKDTGVYVCFGANLKGYSYRKAYLKVIPQLGPQIQHKNIDKSLELDHSQIQSSQHPDNLNVHIQSIGLFIILVPVILISSFAIASICLLKRLDDRKNKSQMDNESDDIPSCSLIGFIKRYLCSSGSKSEKSEPNKTICCCFPGNMNHVLIESNYDNNTMMNEKKKSKNKRKSTLIDDRINDSCGMPCVASSLGSSLSDSSSTTATTVAYYATVPLLMDDNKSSPPPPLPSSQPPTFSPELINNDKCSLQRTVSTPSMAYYKIVDSDMFADNKYVPGNAYRMNNNNNDDAATCVSTNSRFYYQLTPSTPVQNNNFNNFQVNL